MKTTIFLIGLAVAGFLGREGYTNFAYFLVGIATMELVYETWWRPRQERRAAQKND